MSWNNKEEIKKRCILLAVTWNYITMHGYMNVKFQIVPCFTQRNSHTFLTEETQQLKVKRLLN